MIKIIFWVCVAILGVILAKRIANGIFVTGVFIISLFIGIFVIDTFTTVDIRKYVGIGFYDKSVQDPNKVASELKDKAYSKGEGAITSINQNADDWDKEYGTETESQKEARKAREAEEKANEGQITSINGEESSDNLSIDDQGNVIEDTNGNENVSENTESKTTEGDKTETQSENKVDGESNKEQYIKYTDVKEVLDTEYPNMSEDDKAIVQSITPNLKMDIKGKEYRVYNDGKDKKGFYIQKIGK